eukprot:sb/3474220/
MILLLIFALNITAQCSIGFIFRIIYIYNIYIYLSLYLSLSLPLSISPSLFLPLVFILDLYKRWASPRKDLKQLAYETLYLDYSIPSFKVPGVFGALAPWEVCFWHQNYQKEFFAGSETLLKCFLVIVKSKVIISFLTVVR